MTDQNLGTASRQEVPPEGQLMQLTMGNFVSQAVYVAAKLGFADHLSGGPRSAADIAKATEADERSVYRLLRALASVGVFAETSDHTFTNTPISETLRSDSPKSMRAMVLMVGDPEHGRVVNDLLYR